MSCCVWPVDDPASESAVIEYGDSCDCSGPFTDIDVDGDVPVSGGDTYEYHER